MRRSCSMTHWGGGRAVTAAAGVHFLFSTSFSIATTTHMSTFHLPSSVISLKIKLITNQLIWCLSGTSDSNSRHTAPPINVFDIWSSASQGLNAVDQVAVGTYTSGQRKRRRPKKTLTRIVPRKLLSFAQSAKYCHYAYAVHCVLKSDP